MTVSALQTLHPLTASSVKYSKSLFLDILLSKSRLDRLVYISDP